MPGLTSGVSDKSPPATEAGAKRAYPPLRYHDYCSAQKAIAEANSRRDGKVYKAPCELDAPAPKPSAPGQPPATPEPSTVRGWRAHVSDEPKPI